MAKRFGATVTIDRPIEEVFAFLVEGENDKRFSPRVLEIAKVTDGPPGVGTVFASTVKDAGVKTKREFELTAVEPPSRIRWKELSKAPIVVPEGGYDMVPAGQRTELSFYNELEGRGFGKVLLPLAARAADRGADDFVDSIKRAIEAG